MHAFSYGQTVYKYTFTTLYALPLLSSFAFLLSVFFLPAAGP